MPADSAGPTAGAIPSFGCLFIPQFPVWAARFTTPSLAARPLLVQRSGKVVAACPHCLELGIRLDWTVARAQALCPQALVSACNPAEIAYAWDTILSTLYDLTPQLESVRPGLLFFGPPKAGSQSWLSFMAAVAKHVREWQAQAVLAADRSTAEIAAQMVFPGTVRSIRPGREYNLLSQVPCRRLTGLGLNPATAQKLEWFGFRSVVDLQVLSREQIASQFAECVSARGAGSARGVGSAHETALLWRAARAGTQRADRQPVQRYQPPPVCNSRVIIEPAATCPGEWEGALWDAVQQAAAQLNGMSAGAITLSLRIKSGQGADRGQGVDQEQGAGQGQHTSSKLLREDTSSTGTLLRYTRDMMQAAIQPDDEVEAVEVSLSRLVARGVQTTLFEGIRCRGLALPECPPRLRRALRNVEARYTGTLWRWLLRDEHAPLPEERYAQAPLRECEGYDA